MAFELIDCKFVSYRIPQGFLGKLQVASDCALTPEEVHCFELAIEMMDKALVRDGLNGEPERVTVFFLSSDSFTLRSTKEDILGNYLPLVMLYVGRWRERGLAGSQLITIMLEELCHCFYRQADERLVQHQVLCAFQTLRPQTRLEDIYSAD